MKQRIMSKVCAPISLIKALWWRLCYIIDPVRSPISPLAWIYRLREANYYRRTLHDKRLAQQWEDHYLGDINIAHGSRILDHGCGKGRHVALMKQLGYEVYGQDISNHPWWKHLPCVGFQVVPATTTQLPWATASFDLVIDAQVIGHFSPLKLQEHAREVSRVLRPGGHWLILEANTGSFIAHKVLRHYGRLHSLQDFLELSNSLGFKEVRQSFEGFYAPAFPLVINLVRKAFGPWHFDLADYHSWLARLLPAQRRGMWLLDLTQNAQKS